MFVDLQCLVQNYMICVPDFIPAIILIKFFIYINQAYFTLNVLYRQSEM